MAITWVTVIRGDARRRLRVCDSIDAHRHPTAANLALFSQIIDSIGQSGPNGPANGPSQSPRLPGTEEISRSVHFTQSVFRSLKSWYPERSPSPLISSSDFKCAVYYFALLACSLLLVPFVVDARRKAMRRPRRRPRSNPTAAKSTVVDGEQLKKRLDDAIAFTQTRVLNADQNNTWQIMHGILAYGHDLRMQAGGQVVPALDWMLAGGTSTRLDLASGRPRARRGSRSRHQVGPRTRRPVARLHVANRPRSRSADHRRRHDFQIRRSDLASSMGHLSRDGSDLDTDGFVELFAARYQVDRQGWPGMDHRAHRRPGSRPRISTKAPAAEHTACMAWPWR